MNTTPTMITPARAIEPAAGKPQDSATPDTTFSQVLSGEMANPRNAGAAKPAQDAAGARQDVRTPSSDTAVAEAAVAEATAPAGEAPLTEAQAAELAAVAPDATALLGLPAAPTLAAAGTPLTGSVADAIDPEAINAGTSNARTLNADVLGRAADASARKGPASASKPGSESVAPGLAAPRAEADAVARPAPQATPQAAAATAFANQLAAARLNDAMARGDGSLDQLVNPTLHAAARALQESPVPNAEAALPRLAPAVGSSAWSQALGDRIVWMTAAQQQTATLTLNPPNMGPLQVVLNISNDQAVANFFSAQPEVRQALEAAFPRLKEMMNEAGIQLEQATVSADTPQQQRDDASGRPGPSTAQALRGEDTLPDQAVPPTPVRQIGRGLIDTFA